MIPEHYLTAARAAHAAGDEHPLLDEIQEHLNLEIAENGVDRDHSTQELEQYREGRVEEILRTGLFSRPTSRPSASRPELAFLDKLMRRDDSNTRTVCCITSTSDSTAPCMDAQITLKRTARDRSHPNQPFWRGVGKSRRW